MSGKNPLFSLILPSRQTKDTTVTTVTTVARSLF
jgi:hypothetical protein